MKKLIFVLFALLTMLPAHAVDRIVGGDLSMIPAYEAAGDKWLDENGNTISDLITYVKNKGWNCVRIRLFLDPTKDTDPSTCQDFDYVAALGARVKAADMNFMLDFHYSDTWADPSTQKIPSAWSTDNASLASTMYSYSYDIITRLIDSEATPDYVAIGNEITYGLLWNTADGKYPASSADYATAGYCPTWNSAYSPGQTQWKRTASLLNNAAHGVHKGFHDQGIDSTEVKLIVHTEMSNSKYNSDNFFKHIRTAGFDNYDVIGLSYYPFWHGPLTSLTTLLNTITKDFPDKDVQIVETAWYTSSYYPYAQDGDGEYSIASLNSKWTANGDGTVNYLSDLIDALDYYSNVTGLIYWQPEECGRGYSKTVMNTSFSRGLWKNGVTQNHSQILAADGTAPVKVLTTFLGGGNKEPEKEDMSTSFQNLGFETGDLTGWTASQTWTTMWPNNISSWADPNVYSGTYTLELWNSMAADGAIISQVVSGLPAGRYTVSVKARAEQAGFYVYANNAKTAINANDANTWAVSTDVKNGILEIGLGTLESLTAKYIYADDFTVTRIGDITGEDDNTEIEDDGEDENQFTDDQNIIYSLWRSDNTASVISGAMCGGEITIPATITVDEEVFYVTSINKDAFANNNEITNVVIGKNVYGIWGSAFNECNNLQHVSFEEGSCLASIDGWAFHSTAIDTISVPAGVSKIADGTFSNCWNLNKVVLNGNITSIGDFAFSGWAEEGCTYNWSPLSEGVYIYAIEAPEISEKAFFTEDIAEKTLYVHYTLLEDEKYTALGFKEILPLDEEDTNTYYTDEQGVVYLLNENGTATVMGYDVSVAPSEVANWQIEIPESITAEYEGDEKNFDVTAIADEAFNNHWTLTSVTLPESIESIGAWAFCNTAISEIEIFGNVRNIAEGTFSKCWNLKKVILWGDMETIGDFAFSSWALEGCASLGTALDYVLTYSYTVPEISDKAFCTDDIASAKLFVDKRVLDDFTAINPGFAEVLTLEDFETGISAVAQKKNDAPYYNIQGVRFSAPTQRGVYIRNGKTIIK